MSKRLQVLLITEACDGTDVGEAWSSQQWASRLSEIHDVTLLTTQSDGRLPVAAQVPKARVIAWRASFDHWGRLTSMLKPGYVPFYYRAAKWIQMALSRGEYFDVAHQLSPLAIRYPSPAAGRGMPFIIGPLGGSIETPGAFRHEFKGGNWYTRLRGLDRLRLQFDPLLRRTLATASVIIGVAPYVRELLSHVPLHEFEIQSETGVVTLPPETKSRELTGSLNALFVGRLVRSKGARDAVRAIAKVPRSIAVTLDVIGDGEDFEACHAEAAELNITDRVKFRGRIPRSEVDTFYQQSDIFLFPSLREPSGNAVLEAMSHGLPCIVADRGGPGYVVDNSCGMRITPSYPDQYATELADAIQKLAGNHSLRREMGQAAREKIRNEFLWERKVDWLCSLYERTIESAGRLPSDVELPATSGVTF